MRSIVTKIIFTVFIFLSSVSCTPRYLSSAHNKQNFPIEYMSELFDMDPASFVRVTEIEKPLEFKHYDFFVLDYSYNGKIKSYTVAASKDRSIYFLLNYPDRFSFNNFNKVVGLEENLISDESDMLLFTRMFSKLFIPDTVDLDAIRVKTEKDNPDNASKISKLFNKFETVIDYKMGGNIINAKFHSLSNGSLLYEWDLSIHDDGTVKNCKVNMLSLDSDYEVKDKAVMLDRDITSTKENAKEEDPLTYSE